MKYIALCDIADTELYFAGFINEQIITTNKEFLHKVSTETGITDSFRTLELSRSGGYVNEGYDVH